jgi:AFG3 family protein
MAKSNQNRPGLPERPSGDDKGKSGPRFSIYWIYALIAVVLIGANFWGKLGPDTIRISEQEFKSWANQGDINKIDLVGNKNIVRVYVKPESLNKPGIRPKFTSTDAYNNALKASKSNKPLFDFQVNEWVPFEERLQDFYKTSNTPEIPSESIDEGEWFGPLANTFITLLLIVGIWILLMRKMSGGAGGGGGPGGIFNIGKSKATLFDKGTKVNITFSDVAGLDEAKVEVMEIVDFLRNPKKYTALGGKIPKGALLGRPSRNR